MVFQCKNRLAGLFVCGVAVLAAAPFAAAHAAKAAKPAISQEASAALLAMGNTLLAKEFSFEVRTIRAYPDSAGRALHIFHTLDVVVRRPDRLRVTATGDDGASKLFYDGSTVSLVAGDKNQYASAAVPNTIQGMMQEVMGRLQVDFPLADFLTEAPNKAFLTGVTSGREVNTVTIDGAPYRHLFFAQPPGIELELWLANTEQALPRRLIVTYRSLPGQPSFIAEFSKWDFSVHPSDAEFVFQPPQGAVKVALKRPVQTGSSKR